MKRRRGAAALLGALLALAAAATASAHAALVRSEPAAGATLQAPPAAVVLEFSERLDPQFSRVQLYNAAHQLIDAGPGAVDQADPKVLRLALDDLPVGSYTAIWRARSADDGHTTEGSVPFGVGVAAPAGSLVPPPGAPDPATALPAAPSAASRWLSLLSAALALGGLPYGLLVWRPAYRRAAAGALVPSTERERRAARAGEAPGPAERLALADDAQARLLRRTAALGGALSLLAALFSLVAQAAAAAQVSLAEALGAPLAQILASYTGQLTVARAALIGIAALAAWRLPPPGRGAAWPWWAALAAGALALLTFSLNAHGASREDGRALAVAMDWLHMAAMAAWVGGLVPLAAGLAARRRGGEAAVPLRDLVPRFSRLGLVCVGVLALTGTYAAAAQVGDPALLLSTTYGRALLAKLALFAALVAAGALNLLVISPRLRDAGEAVAAPLGRTVRVELALGALALLAAAAMTSVAPSQAAWREHQRQGVAVPAQVGEVGMVLRIAPAQVGDNEFAVDIADGRPGAAGAPSRVLMRFDMQGMQMEPLQAETSTDDQQRYTARGSYTSMGGRWDIEVVLRRAGFDDVRHTFQVDITRQPDSAP